MRIRRPSGWPARGRKGKSALTRTGQPVLTEAKDEAAPSRKERIVCQPAVGVLQGVDRSASRTARKSGTEPSWAGFTTFGKALFHRARLALGKFPFQFLEQRHAAPSGREILFDLLIPRLFFHLLEPVGQLPAIRFTKLFNGGLDTFHGHRVKLTFLMNDCKSKRSLGRSRAAAASLSF